MMTYMSEVLDQNKSTRESDPLSINAQQLLEVQCTLCDEANGSRKFLNAVFGFETSRTILENSSSLVVPSLGQIVEGYLLVFPKRHVQSWALLPEPEFSEFEQAVSFAEDLVKEKYGSYVLFEHGLDSSETNQGCGVTHAHVHIVPGKVSFNQIRTSLKTESISSYQELKRFADSMYILMKCNNSLSVAGVSHIESQFLRQFIAKELGVPHKWNWKEYVGKEQVLQTKEVYTNALLQTVSGNLEKEYADKFMALASMAAENATCNIRKVGAVLVADGQLISNGWNGSLSGLPSCQEIGHLWQNGHCKRTIHAEAMCIANASRMGVCTEGSDLFVTAFPCFDCFKLVVASGVRRIFIHPYTINPLVLRSAHILGVEFYKV